MTAAVPVPASSDGFGAILPPCVSAAVARGDLPGARPLPPEERLVSRAVESRRREFATARACARAALAPWGLSRRAIPAGPGGEPRWPAGIVGSITHCDGYRAGAVAPRADVLAIGIDAEPNRPLPAGVLGAVSLREERALVRRLGQADPRVCWDRLLFSAKEAVFKAWFSLSGRRLSFERARLAVDPRARTFAARILDPDATPEGGRAPALEGRWALDGGHVLTSVVAASPGEVAR